ncbi:hypothetical protein BT93_J1027 [Corymbia citriodora subsp. variegata]|nr:hypothetical protein BT93_J1027 [Corymbia citriodora subsp. variegata]
MGDLQRRQMGVVDDSNANATGVAKKLNTPAVSLAKIELFVCLTALLLILRTIFGLSRHWYTNRMLKIALFALYTIPSHLISHMLGLMEQASVDTKTELFLKMWACQGWLLSSSGGDEDCKLKDICLSFSLYKLLALRFCSYSLPKEAHKKLWKFIRNGLLAEENGYERAFRVIELELSFLFDSFYTKYPIIFQSGCWKLKLMEISLLFIGSLGNKRIRKLIGLICRTQILKPWERKLRQYSLLESHGYTPTELLEGCKTGEERIRKLEEFGKAVDDTNSVIKWGAQIGQQLLTDKKDPAFIWKVLAKFWAELMVYVAPSDDAKAHVENLATGGEFVTHLWALISHADIKRGPPAERPTLKRSQSWSN